MNKAIAGATTKIDRAAPTTLAADLPPVATTPTPDSPPRPGSKGAAMLALLQRDEGASLEDMAERTGWRNHSVRAAMTGLRKRGYLIDRRITGTMPIWFIAAAPSDAVVGAQDVPGAAV